MKFLMAILRGAWIVGAPWVAACVERGAPAPEEDYEVQVLCPAAWSNMQACPSCIVIPAWRDVSVFQLCSINIKPLPNARLQSDCMGNVGGPILGRLQVAEHRQLMRGYEVIKQCF